MILTWYINATSRCNINHTPHHTYPAAVYKTWILNVLECSLYLNLGILSVATLYVRYTGGSQGAVTYTSVSIAFAKFVAIFVYHIYQQLKSSNRRCLKMITSIPACYRRCNNDAAQRGELSESQQLVLTFDENNEPFLRLLTEDDNNNHAVHQTCSTVSTLHFSDLLSMWFLWWQCGHLFCSVFWMSGWGRTHSSQWDESHKKLFLQILQWSCSVTGLIKVKA